MTYSIIQKLKLEGDFRLDAEYYQPEYLEIENKIKKHKFSNFEEITKLFVKGIFDINSSVYTDQGVPFVRISNLKDLKIDDSDIVYITEEENNKNKKTELKYGDIVLSKTAYPACSLITLKRCNTSQDIIAIKLKEDSNILSRFLVVFLNTKFGMSQMRRYFTGNIQMHLNLTESRKILIPVFSINFQEEIGELFDQSIKKQTESKKLYKSAEDLILKELDLKDFEEKDNDIFSIINFFDIKSNNRMDAEYYQAKYKRIINKIEEYDGGWDLVENIINIKDKNYFPNKGEKYKYLALSNISSQGYIQDYQEELGENLPTRARRKINIGDVIISSIEGSSASCAIVEEKYNNTICSTGFFVLKSEKLNPETLLILFKSSIIQELLQRGSKGAILTAISKAELESIKIPLIGLKIQKQIANLIQASHKARNTAKELLETAKRKVEKEIEK